MAPDPWYKALAMGLFFLLVACTSTALLFVPTSLQTKEPTPLTRTFESMKIRSPFGAVITQQNIDLLAEHVAFLADKEHRYVGEAIAHFRKRTGCEVSAEIDHKPITKGKKHYDWVGYATSNDIHVAVRAKGCI